MQILKRRGRATVIGEEHPNHATGKREGQGVLISRKPGDLPVLAVIYLRARGSTGRTGFYENKTQPFGAGFLSSPDKYKMRGRKYGLSG